ncbi:hypothetical protein AK88_00504 [Plasmodium fragile]|uniref:Surface protein P113 n=1 Tax=Plasmodium fragile TaxID=5857 RepID=A0A0D9QU51_PLAFR|nr:uncharacterized protein AK88_00504 [Plasmodium fragile]KJP89796.1 hypothetical protein AK88_00504 [Plasmodium fragile]
MKNSALWRIAVALLLPCLVSRTRCYVNNDVVKFGEENSLNCPEGSLYILHCEVQCMNAKKRIIHRSCMAEVEAKCMGHSTCKYYFEYVLKSKAQSLRNQNEIKFEECVESEKNEIKTSTTCLLSNSFFLEENYIQYFFFIKNKNEEPITCKDGNVQVKSALLHSPFCKINLKDVTEVLKRQCDNNKECLINPYVLQKDTLNEKDQCYINNSYISLNVVCTREGEGMSEVTMEKGKGRDEMGEGNNDAGRDKSESGDMLNDNDDDDALNEEDELREVNDEVNGIMQSDETFTNKIKKAKTILLSQMNEQVGKKNAIFKLLGEEISKMLMNKYEPSDLKDLLEDRYNEMKRSLDQDLYYIYLLETLNINKMDDVDITSLQDNLANVLKEQMEQLKQVENSINWLRKKYLFIYNEAKSKDMKDMFDTNVDPVLTYEDFAHGNGLISADIFFKYKPNIQALQFNKANPSDTEKGVEEEEEEKKKKKKEYKDLLEIDTLDDYNRKNRIVDMRNGLVENLKKLYYEKNAIFNNLASCIKSYCYKNPLNLNMLSHALKSNFEHLKEEKITDPVEGIVKYLDNVGVKRDSPAGTSPQVEGAVGDEAATDGAAAEGDTTNEATTEGAIAEVTPLWEKNKRILQKLHALLHLGYHQAYEKELQIDERVEKYTALNEKAKEYNLSHLFNESDKVLKKVALLTSANEEDGQVFGHQASSFDVYKEEDAVSVKSGETSKKGHVTSDNAAGQYAHSKMNKKEEQGKGSNTDEEEDDMNYSDEGYESDEEDANNKLGETDKGEEQKMETDEHTDGVHPASKKGGDKNGALDHAGRNDEDGEEDDDEEEAAHKADKDTNPPGQVAKPAEADQNDVPVKGEDSDGAAKAEEQPTGEAVVKGNSEGAISALDTEQKGHDGGSLFQGLSKLFLTVLPILSFEFLL